MSHLDPKIVAAIIAAITSVVILVISWLIRTFYEKHFHIFKLEQEHRYEQRKKIKEILSKNKIQLLNTCESLNHRLWNFSKNYKEYWHRVNEDYSNVAQNYFNSFVYRLIIVLSWIRNIEKEMIYLDTTISTKEDLELIKYLKLLPQILCDVELYNGFEYDKSCATDHFFRNNLENMADSLIIKENVIQFTEFLNEIEKYSRELEHICMFIDGISPDEGRLRWDRLQLFHITIIAFLNSFGYDFQYTSKEKVESIISKPRKTRLIRNYISLLERNKIDKQSEIKKIIKIIS